MYVVIRLSGTYVRTFRCMWLLDSPVHM